MLFHHPVAFWCGVGGVVALAGFFQSTAGFGFALLAVPALSLFIPPQTAVVVVLLVSSFMSVLLARAYHDHIDVPLARRLCLGAVCAMPLGVVLLVAAPTVWLRLLLGVVTIAAALYLAIAKPQDREPSPARPGLTYLTGALSGVLSTALSTNGPPLVIYLRGRHLSAHGFRGTISVVFCVCNVVAVAMLFVSGAVHLAALQICAIGFVPAMAGWAVGLRAAHRVSVALFTRLVDVLLLTGGVLTLVKVVASP